MRRLYIEFKRVVAISHGATTLCAVAISHLRTRLGLSCASTPLNTAHFMAQLTRLVALIDHPEAGRFSALVFVWIQRVEIAVNGESECISAIPGVNWIISKSIIKNSLGGS